MRTTKHDLSYGRAEIDFKALLKTAETAYFRMSIEISSEVTRLDGLGPTITTSHLSSVSHLKRLVELLAITAETFQVLQEAEERKTLVIVNRDEHKITQVGD